MKINPVVGVIFGVLLMVSMPSFGKGGSNVIEIAEVDHELEQLGGGI